MYIAKEYGYPIPEQELEEILKHYSNHQQMDSLLLDCLYNTMSRLCYFSESDFSLQCAYRTPQDRNDDIKISIRRLRYCVNFFRNWNMDVDDFYLYIDKLRQIRLYDLNYIKEKRRKARYKKKTRKEYNRLRPKLKAELEGKFGSKCIICESTNHLQIDHIKPVFKRGGNHIDNLQILCVCCHQNKSRQERR